MAKDKGKGKTPSKSWKKLKIPAVPKAKADQKIKHVDFKNGSRLVRTIDTKTNSEEWQYWNAGLCDIEYTFDLKGSKNCKWDGKNETFKLKLAPMTAEKWNLEKAAGFNLKFNIRVDKEKAVKLQD